MAEKESGNIKNGEGAAAIANSLRNFIEAVTEQPEKPAPPRTKVQKVEHLDPEEVFHKKEEIIRKETKKTPDFKNLPADAKLVQIAQAAVEDAAFESPAQAEAVKQKLLDLRNILTSTPPSQQVERLSAFFKQADNWTPGAAPYMSLARQAVMEHYLYGIQRPEQYNVLSVGELVVDADRNLPDYDDVIDVQAQEREHPTISTAVRNEQSLEDYRVMDEFETLPTGERAPSGMKDFAHTWEERVQLVHDGQAYWDVFDERRLQNDLKNLEDLVNNGSVSNADVQPWRNTINKYLNAKRSVHEMGRRGGRERNTISVNDIEKNEPGFWKNRFKPDHAYEFSGYMKQEDVDILMQHNGEKRWFKKYLMEKIAAPRGEAQPTFTQGIKLEEVEQFLEWKYGGEEGEIAKVQMRRTRFGVEHAHGLNKAFTQEGLSAEKMLEAYMSLTPDDLNFLHEFPGVNKAIPIYEMVINTTLSERRARWFQLRDGNDKLGILSQKARAERIKALEQKLHLTPEVLEGLDKELQELKQKPRKNVERIKQLEEEIKFGKEPRGTPGSYSDAQLELARLKQEHDDYAYGVALWGSDWDYDPTEFNRLKDKWDKIKELRSKPTRTSEEQKKLEELNADEIELADLMGKSRTPEQQKRADFLKKRIADEHDIVENHGLSSLEIKVKKQMMLQERMRLYKKLQPGWSGSDEALRARIENELKNEDFVMDTKMAILMARYDFVYTRHVVAIAGNYRIVGDEEGAKYPMRAPVLEDLERVYAWQTFFKRFKMGAEAGETAMAIFNRETQFHKSKDGKLLKLSESKFWKRLTASAEKHPEQQATLDAIKTWEEKSGISFAQVLNNQVLKGGGVYDASTWRAEIGVTDELRAGLTSFIEDLQARAQAEGPTAVPDNAGIAFQFAAAKGSEKRLYLLEKMRRRDPLIFMEYMAEERYKLLKDGQFISSSGEPLVDFDILSQSLSLANNDINLNKKLLVSPDIDLAGKDFETFVAPYIKQLFSERAITGDITKYKEFTQRMMDIAKEKAPEWAKTDFPMTLRTGDLDWEQTDYHKAGTLSMARRGRDNVGMYKAASILRDLMSNHELMFHPDPNKVIDKLLEMEREMIGYTGTPDALQAFTDGLATYIRMNEARHRRIIGWAPGGVLEWGLRQLSEVHEDIIERGVKMLPIRLFGIPKDKVEAVQKRIIRKLSGNLVSYAVEYGSSHSNAFDEKAIATIISTAQDRGGFVGNKRMAHDLMREFKVTLGYRIVASVRRTYWVALVAVMAAAIASAMKDEEKHH